MIYWILCATLNISKISVKEIIMKDLISALDNLPLVVKIILAVFLDIVWHIYRIMKSVDTNNTTALIVSIILLFIPFMGIIDLIVLILKGEVLYLDVNKQ